MLGDGGGDSAGDKKSGRGATGSFGEVAARAKIEKEHNNGLGEEDSRHNEIKKAAGGEVCAT